MRYRSLTAASLAIAAGVCGVAAQPAKGDIDWGISLNLGWSSSCYAPYSNWYGGGWGYGSWYGGGYCRPHYYAPYYGGYYSPWYGGYYYSYPQYAFSTPLYLPSGSTYVYSSYTPWGSGFTYTTQTFYTPYANYYAPAGPWSYAPAVGLTLAIGSNWWDDDHHHDHHDHDDHHGHDGHHDNNRNNAHNGRSGGSNSFPTATTPASTGTTGPVAQSFGTAGPAAMQDREVNSKGPRMITPVRAKPVESKPTLPMASWTQPTTPASGTQASTKQPLPSGRGARPSLPTRQPGPLAQNAPAKPTLPVLTMPAKTPSPSTPGYKGDTRADVPTVQPAPQRADKPSIPSQGWSKPRMPTAPTSDKPGVTQVRTPYRPSVGIQMPTAPAGRGVAQIPSAKTPSFSPSPATLPSIKPSAPSPAAAIPTSKGPRAPSAKPSGPSNSGGHGGGFGGGKHR